jgi:hypothetical protein
LAAAYLSMIGIVAVCDVGGRTERDHQPYTWWTEPGAVLLQMDILAGIKGSSAAWDALRADPSINGAHGIMVDIYRELPATAGVYLARIFREIAEEQTPMEAH